MMMTAAYTEDRTVPIGAAATLQRPHHTVGDHVLDVPSELLSCRDSWELAYVLPERMATGDLIARQLRPQSHAVENIVSAGSSCLCGNTGSHREYDPIGRFS